MCEEIIKNPYRRVWVCVNLDALHDNLRQIAACRKNDAGIIAVIKADGYGHGAVMLAREMDEIPEVIGYAVATEEEAVLLADAGIKKPAMVLGYTFSEAYEEMALRGVHATVFTDQMLEGAPSQAEAISAFLDFVGDRPLAAHNAEFDISFIRAGSEKVGLPFDPTYVDSLILAQNLLPELHKYKLDIVADYLDLPAFNHHRASDDAGMVAYMLVPFFQKMRDELHIHRIQQINNEMAKLRPKSAKSNRFPKHIIILAKNKLAVSPFSSRYFFTMPKAVFSASVPMVPARNTWVLPNISMAWRWARD